MSDTPIPSTRPTAQQITAIAELIWQLKDKHPVYFYEKNRLQLLIQNGRDEILGHESQTVVPETLAVRFDRGWTTDDVHAIITLLEQHEMGAKAVSASGMIGTGEGSGDAGFARESGRPALGSTVGFSAWQTPIHGAAVGGTLLEGRSTMLRRTLQSGLILTLFLATFIMGVLLLYKMVYRDKRASLPAADHPSQAQLRVFSTTAQTGAAVAPRSADTTQQTWGEWLTDWTKKKEAPTQQQTTTLSGVLARITTPALPVPTRSVTDFPIAKLDTKAEPNRFMDITQSGELLQAANKLSRLGIISGYPDHTFHAERPINRAEMAKIIVLARFATPPALQNVPNFLDVTNDDWFAPFVQVSASFGIITGYPHGTFEPELPVTTAEFLKMLSVAFALPQHGSFDFHDVPKDSWFAPYAGNVSRYDLLPHRSAGLLQPTQPLTRGDVAIAIQHLLISPLLPGTVNVRVRFGSGATLSGSLR